jgi:Ni,Fe-hydrogenase III large subunit
MQADHESLSPALVVHNGESVPVANIPCSEVTLFRAAVLGEVAAGGRLAALLAYPAESRIRLTAILAHGAAGHLALLATEVGDSYPALTPECPQAHWFEREIAEQWGVLPEGHPWLKPIRFQRPYRADRGAPPLPGVTEFFRVRGEEVHEVAVGPVHAGVIEPGHFRFQCHGEQVLHLEISLGYQHRGVERALVGGPDKRTVHYVETLAGDTSVGHAIAHGELLEGLAGCGVPARAQVLRGVALELERLANHAGDLGALAGDVAYLPTAAYCGRIRGDFLNLTALLCGSRFGRGLVRPGGVGFDVDEARVRRLLDRLEAASRDVASAVNLLWNSPSAQARFERTGTVSRAICESLGLVGPVARACGVERDVRHEFPSGIFRFSQLPLATWGSGDVLARAYVRWLEIQRSLAFVREQLTALPLGSARADVGSLAPNRLGVALVEGWRGEICHVAVTDASGRFARYKVVDPSFHNWAGLAMALRDQQISDFPLCNKSFNLSYCGHDL